jgi:agmatine/peptidylarginine deiminase
MEKELENFSSFNLIPIPLPTAIYNGNLRKPATYANFLITNKSVLVPLYNVPTDREAIRIIKLVFPNRKIIGIDCTPLIQQNGSLHCVTMQYVKDSLDLSLLNA